MTQQHLHNGRSHFAYAGQGLADWLGTVPSHWGFRRAKNFFREIDIRSDAGDEELLSVSHLTGVTPRSEKNVTMFEAESYEGSKLCWPGDLVINTMWAWMGALGVSSHHGIVSPSYAVYRLTSADAFNPRYLDFLLRTQPYASEYYCRSTGIRDSRLRLYPDEFLKIPLLYPPRDEQDAIVEFLDRKLAEIDRFIANKSSIIALLGEQKANVIFEGVTTGFQPRAKMRRTGIEWLPEIPNDFSMKKFKYCAIVRGGQVDPRLPEFEDQVLIAPNHIESKTGRLLFMETAKAQGADSGKYLVAQGDVIYSKIRPNLQKATIAPKDCLCSADMYGIRPSNEVSAEYLMYWLLSPPFTAFAVEESMRVAMPKINRDSLGRALVAFPSRTKQDEIVNEIKRRCQNLDTAAECAEKDVAAMNEFRSALITEAVSGKINVRSKT